VLAGCHLLACATHLRCLKARCRTSTSTRLQVISSVWATQQGVGDVPHFGVPAAADPRAPHFHTVAHTLWRTRGRHRYATTGSLACGHLVPDSRAARRAAHEWAAARDKAAAEMASLRGMFTMQMRVRLVTASTCWHCAVCSQSVRADVVVMCAQL
jgi:hypothetical protein